MAQSVIGELTKARRLRSTPPESPYYSAPEGEILVRMVNERIEGFRRELLDEVERRRRG